VTDSDQPSAFGIWLALGAVYVIWGSTYLAIRVLGLHGMPPLLTAGARFLTAGLIMFAFGSVSEDSENDRITAVHWRSAFIVGGALLLGGNGLVVFAEQRVASGVTALMIAATPIWFAVFSRVFFKERMVRLTGIGLTLGLAGLVILIDPFSDAGTIDRVGAIALLFAPMSWAAGSLYSKGAPLPRRPLVSSGMEMLAGGMLLFIGGLVTGELERLRTIDTASWIAWIYLVLFGSLAGFTCYVWLLKRARTTLVSTYAYVNPVVAVMLGALLLHERLTVRSLVGATVIVAGVAMIVSYNPARAVSEDMPGPS
jgi:drug/metabolite transporter (DMT)-like permease